MRELKFSYRQNIGFEHPVNNHIFSYRCLPKTEPRQEIIDLKIDLSPCDFWAYGVDGFKNRTVYGSMKEIHDHFFLEVSGRARIDWQIYDQDDINNSLYELQTKFTQPGPAMHSCMEYIEPFVNTKIKDYGKACELMDWIHEFFAYEKGITGTHTTAEQAFQLGRGVCQDYAHVMIGMCRHFHIPARYVSGAMIGEGYSHAWVEIFSDGKWYGFDPTNHLLVDDMYIVFSRGRDCKDCVINRGTYWGMAGSETQKINVLVEEIK